MADQGHPFSVCVVPFLGDELPVPAQDRVWRNDCPQFHHGLAAQRFALDRQDAPLVVGQEDAFPAQLVHQGPDLGVLELDDLQLPAVDPAGENEEEELPGA